MRYLSKAKARLSQAKEQECNTLVAKTLAGMGYLKRLQNNAFRVASAGIWRFVMSMSKVSDAESVEGLQICGFFSASAYWSVWPGQSIGCKFCVTEVVLCSDHFARQLQKRLSASMARSLHCIEPYFVYHVTLALYQGEVKPRPAVSVRPKDNRQYHYTTTPTVLGVLCRDVVL